MKVYQVETPYGILAKVCKHEVVAVSVMRAAWPGLRKDGKEIPPGGLYTIWHRNMAGVTNALSGSYDVIHHRVATYDLTGKPLGLLLGDKITTILGLQVHAGNAAFPDSQLTRYVSSGWWTLKAWAKAGTGGSEGWTIKHFNTSIVCDLRRDGSTVSNVWDWRKS